MRIVTITFCMLLTALLLTSCTNYGDKVAKDAVEVFYKDNITQEQAQKTLDLLYPSWNEPGNKKSVQLTKQGDTVYFRMVIDKEKAKDIKDETYFLLANEVSNAVFKGSPVNVDLTDNTFKTIRSFHYKKMEVPDYGKKTSEGNIEVYAKEGITDEDAMQLAKFLDELDGNASNVKSFQASKDDTGLYTVSMVSNPERLASASDEDFHELASVLSDNVFNGSPVILQLTDNTFKPFQSFRHK